ncbi:MAG: hypothetical protein MI754_05665, partial [Chromatiales bacterium]|nr:hypothetical protein [Chromatiales bacterium]
PEKRELGKSLPTWIEENRAQVTGFGSLVILFRRACDFPRGGAKPTRFNRDFTSLFSVEQHCLLFRVLVLKWLPKKMFGRTNRLLVPTPFFNIQPSCGKKHPYLPMHCLPCH